jgi:hypothetical protein
MAYPHDDDDDFDGSYSYGLNEKQIRERMNYAVHGDEDSEDDDIYEAWSGLEDDDDDDDDDDSPY